MALSKDKHYWVQLRAVITSGQWDVKSPAKTPNGSFLSWTELLRKFNKHCKGFSDVAEVASQTQALSSLLSASTIHHEPELGCPFSSSKGPLDLGDDCILPEEQFQKAEAGYSVLKDLPQSDVRTESCSCIPLIMISSPPSSPWLIMHTRCPALLNV